MDVRVRRLAKEESLLAAALHTQSLIAAGTPPAPGHLDDYAAAWLAGASRLPQWVAEADGQHVGTAMLRLGPHLPNLVGRDGTRDAELVLLYALNNDTEIALALMQAALVCARECGYHGMAWGLQVRLPPHVLDASGALVTKATRFALR